MSVQQIKHGVMYPKSHRLAVETWETRREAKQMPFSWGRHSFGFWHWRYQIILTTYQPFCQLFYHQKLWKFRSPPPPPTYSLAQAELILGRFWRDVFSAQKSLLLWRSTDTLLLLDVLHTAPTAVFPTREVEVNYFFRLVWNLPIAGNYSKSNI